MNMQSRALKVSVTVTTLLCFSIPGVAQDTLGLDTNTIEITDSFEVMAVSLNGSRYQQSDMLRPTLTHIYMSSGSAYVGPHDASPRSALLEDFFVDTGADELGSGGGGLVSAPDTNTPGMMMAFTGLTNYPGYNLVVVDRYTADAFIVYTVPTSGAPAQLDVPAIAYGPQMLDMAYYKNPFSSTPTSLYQFNNNFSGSSTRYVRSFVCAVAIDLSALGIPEGEGVSQLFFQDDSRVSGVFDPVFIAGLSATPLIATEISGVSISDGILYLVITNVMAGTSNWVEQCQDLSSSAWTAVGWFEGSAVSTNYHTTITNDVKHSFYRIRTTK